MVIISGPYSSKNPEIKKARVKLIASACVKLMNDSGGKTIAISPLISGLSIIEKSGKNLPDSYEFWQEYCRSHVRTGDTLYVLDIYGWEESAGVKDEIDEAKKCNMPAYLVNSETLEHIKVL